jgi:TonB-linked SusC/RagA family outer membrane protein
MKPFKQILKIGLTLLCFLGGSNLMAQDQPVTGKVLSADDGTVLPGVSVVVKGTTNGTVTDAQGNYKINVSANAILTFSFIGYVAQEVEVGGKTVIDIQLIQDVAALKEVVVVGYGTQTKKAVTGSVASINYQKFKDRSYANITQSLAGELPGVNIAQSQGAPGVSPIIRIRGVSSITAGTNPLYVVDGMPMENFNLNNINAQDIESVEVLKDASSAAIYGSRGANGVILITTKVGKPGKTAVTVGYEHGIQKVVRQIDFMDAQQFIQYYNDAHNNAWVASGPGRSASDPNSIRGTQYRIPQEFLDNPQQFGKGTDWQDVMFRTAPSNNFQVSASGGTEKTRFLVSSTYLDQQAILDQNYYKRFTVRSNIQHDLSAKIRVGVNVALTGIVDRTEGTTGKADVVSLGQTNTPIFPVYNENGNLGFRDPNSTWYRFTQYSDLQLWHPYSITREIDRKNKSYNTLAMGYLEYKIIKGLQFRTSINGNLLNSRSNMYQNALQKYGYSSAGPAIAESNSTSSLNWLSENTLTYNKEIGEHDFTVLAGYTAQHLREEYNSVSASNFPNDLVHTLNAGTVTGGTSIASEWSLLSYLARLNYNFKDKYFLTATIRRDGSSRFGENNKYGYFPSASLGWVVSDEGFMQNLGMINNLKLRVSYGVTGNNQIPNYGSVGLLTASNYTFGDNVSNGLLVNNIPNPNLKWEKTAQFNAGLDLSLFNRRVNVAFDAYSSTTKDLLLNVPVPDITGFSSQLTNIGKLRNRGIELNINTVNTTGAFGWQTDFNFSINRNEVLQLGPNNAPINYNDFSVAVRTEVGQPISNYYGYIFEGVYQNQAQIDGSPHYPGTTPGDPIVRDVNNDGEITADDRTTIGNYQPTFIAGFKNTFTYKGIELSILLQGSYGSEIVNQQVRYSGLWNGGRNGFADLSNYWRSESEPGDGKHFKPTIEPKGLQNQFSSYWVEDGSFLRVRNIRLGYSLNPKLFERMNIVKAVRVYVNAENVFLFTKYSNYDPENTTYNATSFSNTSTTPAAIPSGAFLGVDYGSYPVPRVITIGLKADF